MNLYSFNLIEILLLITISFIFIGSVSSAEVVLDFRSITTMTKDGVAIVDDADASLGKAIELQSGANNPLVANPTVYFEMEFTAPAGLYYIWVRAKSDGDTGTDSMWIQFDDEIGTDKGNRFPQRGIGNWLDVFPAGKYVWASNEVIPPDGPTVESFTFEKEGKHRLRTQPRQVPHRIDQIWLSTTQKERPKHNNPIRAMSVEPLGKLTTTWARFKSYE